MTKQFVKRSYFQIVSITFPNRELVTVEGDEAYVTSLDSAYPITINRLKERDLIKLQAQTAYIGNNTNACIEVSVSQSQGRVSLMGEPVGSALTGNYATFPAHVGIKETISMGIGGPAASPQKVLIETVHYVPADEIAA